METPEPGWTLTGITCTANGAVITIGTGSGGTFAQGATAGEGAATAGADGDHGTVRGAGNAGPRPARLGRLHDVLGPELEGGEVERGGGRRGSDRGVAGEGGRQAGAGTA